MFSLTVKINASSVCNEPNSTDEETIEEIKRLLQDLTKGEDGTHQAEEGEDDEELMCLAKQLNHSVRDWIFVSPYKLMEETSGFDCWQRDGHQIRVLPTEFWLIWIRSFSVILALFSPMALIVLLQQNPPKKTENGVERLSLASDLPLGLNYTLCNWGNNNNYILVMRCFLVFLAFVMMEYIPLLYLLRTNPESYERRNSALYRSNLLNSFWEVFFYDFPNLFCVIIFFVLLFMTDIRGKQPFCKCNSGRVSGGKHSFVNHYQALFQEMHYGVKMLLDWRQWMIVVFVRPMAWYKTYCSSDNRIQNVIYVIVYFLL